MADAPDERSGGRRRWTRAEYHRLGDLGLLDDARTELLAGDIWNVPPLTPLCYTTIAMTADLLRKVCGSTHSTRQRGPVVLSDDTEPEPSVVVVPGSGRDYEDHHPTAAEVSLLVEVSDVSLDKDRELKSALYAAAGVRHYWIVNLVDRQLEVYRDPALLAGGYGFKSEEVLVEGDTVTPLFMPDAALAVRDLLP